MRAGFIPTVMSLVLTGGLAPAAASPPKTLASRTFDAVTPAKMACMETNSRKRYGTVYTPDPNSPNNGMTETHYLGLTKLSFVFDPVGATITYTIVHKPVFASNDQVWNGIRDAIKACS